MIFSIVLLVRKLRPFLLTFGVLGWFLFRIYYYFFSLSRNCDSHIDNGISGEEGESNGTPVFLLNDDSSNKSLLTGLVYCLGRIRSVINDSIEAQLNQFYQVEQQEHSFSLPAFLSYLLIAFQSLFGFCWLLLEDYIGVTIFLKLWSIVYFCYHYKVEEVKDQVLDMIFDWSLRYQVPPQVNTLLQKEVGKYEKDFDKTIGKAPTRVIRDTLPKYGMSYDEIINELQECANDEHQLWLKGKVSGTVYPLGSSATSSDSSCLVTSNNNEANTKEKNDHTYLMNKVYSIYCWSNPLHHGFWPKLNQCESEVVAMAGNMLHAPTTKTSDNNHDDHSNLSSSPIGCVTSGGTESILLAIYAHYIYYGKQRGIQYPELVCGTTAHAAVDKACEIFGIRKVAIDCNEYWYDTNNTTKNKKYQKTYQLSPRQVEKHITSNTIMIYASAPCYPQGVIDPVPKLSEIALRYDIGLHVDACLGGFVLPFMDMDDLPQQCREFDFRSIGVTSMSIDTHKYGFASKGTSVVVYRNKQLRHAQYFCYAKWTGGLYGTPTIAGSRPGGLVMSAWAALVSIGENGYKDHVSKIVNASRTIAKNIASIPGIIVMTDYPTMVVCFSYNHNHNSGEDVDDDGDENLMDIYRIHDEMSKKGWKLNSLQHPPSVHICVTMNVVPKVDALIEDLKESVTKIRNEIEEEKALTPENKKIKKKKASSSTAGIYGTAGTLPDGPVKYLLKFFLDCALSP